MPTKIRKSKHQPTNEETEMLGILSETLKVAVFGATDRWPEPHLPNPRKRSVFDDELRRSPHIAFRDPGDRGHGV